MYYFINAATLVGSACALASCILLIKFGLATSTSYFTILGIAGALKTIHSFKLEL